MGDWDVIIAQATTNLVTNPSLEKSTTGWTAVGGTLNRVTSSPVFGQYNLRISPGAGTYNGAYFGTVALVSGTTYVASLYAKGQTGIPYRVYFGDTSANVKGTPVEFVGDGAWHRYEVVWACDASASYRLYVTKNNHADSNYCYVDGVQIEVGSVATSFCDGSLPAPVGFATSGCSWAGLSHLSASSRVATTRAGGRLYNLEDDYHFRDLQILGAAAPPVENYTTPYALLDGSNYEHSRIAERSFILNGVVVGTSWLTLQQYRAALYAAVQPANNEPVILRYTGGARTVEISAYYDGGLEGGTVDGYVEKIALRFLATSPNWREVIV